LYAAPAPSKNFDAAPTPPPTPTLLYNCILSKLFDNKVMLT
jgi:hypothetical protein